MRNANSDAATCVVKDRALVSVLQCHQHLLLLYMHSREATKQANNMRRPHLSDTKSPKLHFLNRFRPVVPTKSAPIFSFTFNSPSPMPVLSSGQLGGEAMGDYIR